MIELELAGDGKRFRRNPVIRCNIKREGNKCNFSVNGKPSNKKGVMELAKLFSIQIDNLCQFLPQDKVVEFAAMTPIELLRSTQRAVAPQEMQDWHDSLKQLRSQQRDVQAQNTADRDTLTNLESRQRMQEADVERMREREATKEKVGMLEAARPLAEYRAARIKNEEAKERRRQVLQEYKDLEKEVEPLLRAAKGKELYQKHIQLVVKDRKREVDKTDGKAERAAKAMETFDERIAAVMAEKTAERRGIKGNKDQARKLEESATTLRTQMEEPPADLDISSYNEEIRENGRRVQDCMERGRELKRNMNDREIQMREKTNQVKQAERDLTNLESQSGKQYNKLVSMSRDAAQAWKWIQENQDQFEKPVFGPPIVECSIKDPRYVDLIEALFQKNDFTVFTTQTKKDFKKLADQLYQRMKLVQVNIRTMTGGLEEFRPPIGQQEMRQYGFDGWALDFIEGPEPVLAMLCGEGPRLHLSGVSLQDTPQHIFDMLQNSPVSSWVTKKSFYKINRRREYGPGATSTAVRDVRAAQYWTEQPVDLAAKRELQELADGRRQEIESVQEDRNNLRLQLAAVKDEMERFQADKGRLEKEKENKQRVINQFKALPVRLGKDTSQLFYLPNTNVSPKPVSKKGYSPSTKL